MPTTRSQGYADFTEQQGTTFAQTGTTLRSPPRSPSAGQSDVIENLHRSKSRSSRERSPSTTRKPSVCSGRSKRSNDDEPSRKSDRHLLKKQIRELKLKLRNLNKENSNSSSETESEHSSFVRSWLNKTPKSRLTTNHRDEYAPQPRGRTDVAPNRGESKFQTGCPYGSDKPRTSNNFIERSYEKSVPTNNAHVVGDHHSCEPSRVPEQTERDRQITDLLEFEKRFQTYKQLLFDNSAGPLTQAKDPRVDYQLTERGHQLQHGAIPREPIAARPLQPSGEGIVQIPNSKVRCPNGFEVTRTVRKKVHRAEKGYKARGSSEDEGSSDDYLPVEKPKKGNSSPGVVRRYSEPHPEPTGQQAKTRTVEESRAHSKVGCPYGLEETRTVRKKVHRAEKGYRTRVSSEDEGSSDDYLPVEKPKRGNSSPGVVRRYSEPHPEPTGQQAKTHTVKESRAHSTVGCPHVTDNSGTIRNNGDNKRHIPIELPKLQVPEEVRPMGKINTDSYAITSYVMKLPDFHGNVDDWISYKSIYDNSKDSFSRFENVVRLRKSLKGEALECVNILIATNADPDLIIEELHRNYGRSDQMAFREFTKLKDMPRVTNKSKEIVQFARKIRQGVLLFQSLKEDRYINSPELIHYLQDKLPDHLKSSWMKIQTTHSNRATVMHLRDFLDKVADRCLVDLPIEERTPLRRTVQRAHTTTEKEEKAETNKDTGKRLQTDNRTIAHCKICKTTGHETKQCYRFKRATTDKRWELAKEHKLCYRCLGPHLGQQCHMKSECGIDGCSRTHSRLLHRERRSNREDKQKKEDDEVVNNAWAKVTSRAYLKIVPVTVIGPAGATQEYALLDDGSTVTLMEEEIAQKIGAQGETEPMSIQTMSDSVGAPDSRRIEITLANRQGKQTTCKVRTVPKLKLTPQTVDDQTIKGCRHLQKIRRHIMYRSAVPKILIGQDNWNLLIAKRVVKGDDSQPIASETPLGWVLHGSHTRALGHTVLFMNTNTSIDDKLDEYFSLDSLMINPKVPDSDPEKKAEEILKKNTHYTEDGRIETALLWKKEEFVMPNNYENSLKRLVSIEKKLDRNPDIKEKYNEQMAALIEKGYAEKAPDQVTPGKTWYLPHFDVKNPAKPEKFRIVHDAAAKTRGVSLNDFLFTGPDLLKSLPGVLMRFRRHEIAVSADIAEMFMQVKLRQEDRDALRYLWRGDRREGAPEEYRMTSLIFGAACSPCIAIYAKDWNAKRYIEKHPRSVEAIVENHYMDDYLDSFKTKEEAIEVATRVKQIHAEAHLHLRKWISNSQEALKVIEPNQKMTEIVSIGSKEEKILGLMWNPKSDQLGFNLGMARVPAELMEKSNVTKREALKIVMSLYDPLGFASPVTVNAKKILQEAWRKNVDWDQEVDEDLAAKWEAWKYHLSNLKIVNIPRCYPGFSNAVSLQLHVFSDSSETAYSAALYWRAVTHDGQVHVSLAAAKAKVAPLKVTSIPRLELQAAVMGSRLAAAIIEEHRIVPESKTFWTDSKTVLSWVKQGSRSYKPFVAHRIAAIEENSKTDEWRWVPTKMNVADVATREVPVDFGPQHEWFQGPSFLQQPPEEWPSTEKIETLKSTGEERVHTCKVTNKEPMLKEVIPDPQRFSRWERLLRASARVLQFIDLCRKKKEQAYYKRTTRNKEADPDWRKKKAKTPIKKQKTSQITAAPRQYVMLHAEYIKRAEKLLIRASQQEAFDNNDFVNLLENTPLSNSSRLRALPLEVRDGVIMLRSRIAAARGVRNEMKAPPVIDGDQRVTQLYIEWTHRNLHHSSTEAVINEVRQHYWVIKLRPTAKKVISGCLRCRIRKAQPPTPPTGDHPRTRLAHHHRPFTYTGLDYFGPLSVTVGRQHQKRYVALFTCLTTRAVHLEIAASLSADSAIMALRRFSARRGCPTEVHSDNGTNMHAADRELREALQEEASRRGITWKYIVPSAPFMGGAWERLVRCVKTTLYTVLNERHPTEEVLATLLCEVEYTVNSRPLTHVSVDPTDEEAITPNHFLLGGSARMPAPGIFKEEDLITKKHWRHAQALADMFWRRWVREYLPELQNRREPHGKGPTIEVGDPVLIADSQLPRNTWPRGLIEAVYPGKDGHVRIAEVRTAGGVLKRPTKKLVPLPK